MSPVLKLVHVWDGSFVSSCGGITIRPSTEPGFRWQVEYIDCLLSARCKLFTTKREAIRVAQSVHKNVIALRFAKRKVA